MVPHIRRVMNNPRARVATAGASFGAFHAANQFFRRPDLFDTLIAKSGFYDLEPDYTQGYKTDETYFNNPVSYLANMGGRPQHAPPPGRVRDPRRHRPGRLRGPALLPAALDLLWTKGIPHNLDMWGADVNHDWPWWRKMLPFYIGEKVRW